MITKGFFRSIRHPLYASLLYLARGAWRKQIGWIATLLALMASLSLVATTRADERECVEVWGDEYRE
ncbi:MAG: hypothetical protein OEV30_12390 [Ignavibacteria bacterium]|nr:hypothetical protein [Ignavibacteria bacterium]